MEMRRGFDAAIDKLLELVACWCEDRQLVWCMECRSEMQRRNEKLEFERNKERLLFMKVLLAIVLLLVAVCFKLVFPFQL